MSIETFEVDTDLTRDAISCGIWTRLCCEIRGRDEGYRVEDYIGQLTDGRDDSTTVLGYLEADIGFLTDARSALKAVEQTPVGALVELDDVLRFMPRAWHEQANRWLWAPSEIRKVEDEGGHVVMVREFGTDEQLRGDRADPRSWLDG